MESIGAREENRTPMVSPPADFETFRIFIEGETLRYERHPKVFFTNPPQSSTGAVIDAEQGPEATSQKPALVGTLESIVAPESPEK